MPDGFNGGALGFLSFGWATVPVVVAAARDMAYFFGGMACFFAASGRGFGGRKASEREKGIEWREEGERAGEMRGKSVKKRLEKILGSLPGRAHAPFSLAPAPQAPPRAPGSAWVRRHQFWPEPAKNGLLGARLGPFFGTGAAKSPGKGLLGARLEMPLGS